VRQRAHQGALPQAADNLWPRVEKLAALMDAAEADILAFMTFPKELRTKLHSTNPLERIDKRANDASRWSA
jgi:transposase-like protein